MIDLLIDSSNLNAPRPRACCILGCCTAQAKWACQAKLPGSSFVTFFCHTVNFNFIDETLFHPLRYTVTSLIYWYPCPAALAAIKGYKGYQDILCSFLWPRCWQLELLHSVIIYMRGSKLTGRPLRSAMRDQENSPNAQLCKFKFWSLINSGLRNRHWSGSEI